MAVVALFAVASFTPISQTKCAIIEAQGKYSRILGPGWHFIWPMWEKVAFRFDLRETLHDFEPTAVITKDNATVRINAVTYYQITNPHAAAYKIQDFERAMEQLIITTLRNLIGELELDECLNGRNTINTKLQGILDEATHAWGLKVSRVELKEIKPLGEIAEAMDKQMVAERTRRAQILEAEGSKRSAVLQAEGAKEAAILRAEGEREVVLIRAKAEADATLVQARAQQEAIRQVVSAFGSHGDEKFLQLRYMETMPAVAQGKASTIFLPSQMSGLASLAAVAGKAFRGASGPETPQASPAAARPSAHPPHQS
ncbi:MAG: SPFH domain-containing protein [Candidatus Sericytochromatia bacterium]|nr:SPFH domain-containing protein [Candidatus Sericytochromatia bacterium]